MASKIDGHWGSLLNPTLHKEKDSYMHNRKMGSTKQRLTSAQYKQAREILTVFAENGTCKKEALATLKSKGLVTYDAQAKRYIDATYLSYRAMKGYPVKRRSTPSEEVRIRTHRIVRECVESNMTNAALAERLLKEGLYEYYDPHYIRSYASRIRKNLGLPRVKHTSRSLYERKKSARKTEHSLGVNGE